MVAAAHDPFTLYRQARRLVRDGDLLLFRDRSSAIAILGRGEYSHAATAWWHGSLRGPQRVLLLSEFRQWQGGRNVTLSSQVRGYPGRIDVFRPKCPSFVAAAAAEELVRLAGHPYGWLGIARCGCFHAPLVRWLAPRIWDTSDTTLSPRGCFFCSQACGWSGRKWARQLGDTWDPVPGLADWAIEPNHLAHSGSYERVLTRLVHELPPYEHDEPPLQLVTDDV